MQSKNDFRRCWLTKRVFQRAFSIVEILLVLAIFGVLLLIVMPYGHELTGKNRALAYADEIRAALRFTRSSAILLGEPVTFCGSKNHKKCDGLWIDGQIIISDSGNVLRVLSKIFSGDKLRWKSSLGKNDGIVFLPTGFTKGQQLGSFFYCPKNNTDDALAVILSSTGRARISDRDAEGRRISCNF